MLRCETGLDRQEGHAGRVPGGVGAGIHGSVCSGVRILEDSVGRRVPMTGQDSASLLYWWVVWVLGCQVVHCQTVKVLAWSSKRSLDKL